MKSFRKSERRPRKPRRGTDFCGARLFVEHKWVGKEDGRIWAFFWLDDKPYLANEDDA